MSTSTKKLIVIVGPTAIGKTSLSISLAKFFKTDVVSADSRQFYRELEIGTAKPNLQEQSGVKHHFVDSLNVDEYYSAGRYENECLEVLNEIFKSNDYAILVGGSGLFVDAICNGIDEIPSDAKIRSELNERLEKEGIESLQEELKRLDPNHYEKMNLQNPQRLIRALEVCICSGKPYSSFRRNSPKKRPFEILKFGLNTDREIVYDRINHRVDIMMEQGLLEEVKSVLGKRHLNALNTVGYKELFAYLDGELTLEESVELIKKNTRNFAKRQLTWFRKDTRTMWVDPIKENNLLQDIVDKIEAT